MKVLDKYIGRQLLAGTFFIMAGLLTLLGVLNLFEELGEVGKGNYTVEAAFLYVAMGLPRFAYELFPVTVLLGSLAGLGGLAVHSELIAMRAAGISVRRIVLAMLQAGFLLMLLAVLLGELVAPPSEQYAQQMRNDLKSEQVSLRSKYGFWARDGHAFINIRRFLPGNELDGVYVYEFDEQKRLTVATHAERAVFLDGRWLLKGIRQSFISEEGIKSRALEQAAWGSLLEPDLLNVVVVKPHMLPIWGLYRYIGFLKANGQDANQYEVAFWGKLVKPLVTVAMLFLSVPFLFGSLRSVGLGKRVFIGTLIGLGFYMGNKMISYMAVVYAWNPVFASVLPGVLVTALAIWSMRRVH